MVRVLAVSDEVDGSWSPDRGAHPVELILACGDLPFGYLGELMDRLDAPLAFVPGNHDPDSGGYKEGRLGLVLRAGMPADPPWPSGAVNADGRVVDIGGLRVAGLGGSLRYTDGANQYSQRQQSRRARKLIAVARWLRLRDGRGVDVVLTHAPPRGIGDADDLPHQGFTAWLGLMARLEPGLLLHGHVALLPGVGRDRRFGHTIVRNVVGHHVFDVDPSKGTGRILSDHAS